jgi:thiol:disulfide interchange protein DsbD
MLDFYADWCISCKEMEKYAFTHPDVLAALEGFETLQTDVTDNDKTDQLFMKSLGIYGPPAILFFDRDGNEIPKSRVVGEMSGEEFAAHIRRYAGQL